MDTPSIHLYRHIVALGAGMASMGAALTVNLAVVSLVGMLALALDEENK